jgi:glycosyltransferase involved in cell wall biosynthesis
LISDNGLDPHVKAWGLALAAADRRVRYQRNASNLGMAGNWNAIAHSARGEWLVIIGDDDRLLPGFLSTLTRAMLDGVRLAFSNHYVIDQHGTRLLATSHRWTSFYGRATLPPGPVKDSEICAWSNSIAISSALMVTADARRLGFKDDLNTPEIELFIRLAQEGARFVFEPAYLAEFRIHAGSATSAGQWKDRLARYLVDIPVRPAVEPYKRRLLAGILIDAVAGALVEGNLAQARRFVRSPYYPRGRPVVALQRLCLSLPVPWGSRLYMAFSGIRARLRQGARTLLRRDR